MTNLENIFITAGLAVVLLVLLKMIWRVIWGFINWLADKRVRSKNKEAYETLVPMMDYVPFYDLFASDETLEQRSMSNSTRIYVRSKLKKGS